MTRSAVPWMMLAALALTGCAGGPRSSASPASASPASASPASAAPVALDGAALLQRTCTECHSLRGLSAYANYWGEREWRSMVETMIGYGAKLSPDEMPVLVTYLAENYGTARKTSPSPR